MIVLHPAAVGKNHLVADGEGVWNLLLQVGVLQQLGDAGFHLDAAAVDLHPIWRGEYRHQFFKLVNGQFLVDENHLVTVHIALAVAPVVGVQGDVPHLRGNVGA